MIVVLFFLINENYIYPKKKFAKRNSNYKLV